MVQTPWKWNDGFWKNFKLKLPYDPATSLMGIFPGRLKAWSWKDICAPMFIATFFTIANVEATQVPTDCWMDKQNVVHTYNEMSSSLFKKAENSIICYNMDESWGHYAQWNARCKKTNILWFHLFEVF